MKSFSSKSEIKTWLICPKCKINIPKIYKQPSFNGSNLFILSFECECYETAFQMSLNSYITFLNTHYNNNDTEIQNQIKIKANPCITCSSNSDSNSYLYCIECLGFLCQNCYVNHNKTHNLSQSKVITHSKCTMHNQINYLYCVTCEKEICFKCKGNGIDIGIDIDSCNHSKHSVMPIKDYCIQSKDKWSFNSFGSISEYINSSQSKDIEDLVLLFRILFSNYDALTERPSINIANSIKQLQEDLYSFLLTQVEENKRKCSSGFSNQTAIRLKSKVRQRFHDLYSYIYSKRINKKEAIECSFIILMLTQLSNGKYVIVKKEMISSVFMYTIHILNTFYDLEKPDLEVFKQYDELIVALVVLNPTTLVVGLRTKEIEVWDISSKHLITTLNTERQIKCMIKVNEETIAVSAFNDFRGLVWNIRTNFISGKYYMKGKLLSFNYTTVISYEDSEIRVWDINKNKPLIILKQEGDSPKFVVKINNVRLISSSDFGFIKLWNIKEGICLFKRNLSSAKIINCLIVTEKESIYLITEAKTIMMFNYVRYQIIQVIQMETHIRLGMILDEYTLCCLFSNNKINLLNT